MRPNAAPSRREFIRSISAATVFMASQPGFPGTRILEGSAGEKTIREAIDDIVRWAIGSPLSQTVDTVKQGDAGQVLKGITTTFLATCEVIRKNAGLGHNLIISHEPIFYNHLDETDWLQDDPVYAVKKKLIEDTGVVVWRCHDVVHAMKPDPIQVGMRKKLGWEKYADPDLPNLYHLPKTTLSGLADELKKTFGVRTLRSVGDPDMPCEKVAFSIGAPGGQYQIRLMKQTDADALVCGEIHEWETSEYIRDAGLQGRRKGLLLIGHANSEEAGMETFSGMLGSVLPGVPLVHIPAGDPFRSF
ncbi:Nif3-like dinuclear metal center hexameric protein [bacterium]|nr:Nif3-like dinuclear metal center hexameric protein [bacterium]